MAVVYEGLALVNEPNNEARRSEKRDHALGVDGQRYC